MSLTTVEIDGQCYHAQLAYIEDDSVLGYHYGEPELILDEYGKPVPYGICICYAMRASECSCGVWGRDYCSDYDDTYDY